jgi:tyrosine-specific transport protein
MKTEGSLLGGMFLVAGTAIGGGMLALPVLTAEGGFWSTTLLYILCWFFMASTGHLLMEVSLYYKEEVNIVSMAQKTLGLSGKVFAWIFYLFLFYSLTIAYMAGGGHLISYALESLGIQGVHTWLPIFIFVILFAPFVILGPNILGKINTIFVWGLLISFILLLFLGMSHINMTLLARHDFCKACLALPVIFTAFAFQGIVPTLTNYLGRNAKKCALAIWLGSFIPLLAYVVWEALILGVISLEALQTTKILGETAIYPLKDYLQKPSLFLIGKFFAFFAIVTSFFGVALGMMDFLSDGLKIAKKGNGVAFLATIVFFPPLIISLSNPSIFLNALHYAGGLGCALLLGLLPILMAWRGRYHFKEKSDFPLFGGRILLSFLLLFVIYEVVVTFWTLGT